MAKRSGVTSATTASAALAYSTTASAALAYAATAATAAAASSSSATAPRATTLPMPRNADHTRLRLRRAGPRRSRDRGRRLGDVGGRCGSLVEDAVLTPAGGTGHTVP
ncbi:hypothetical protein [Catenulispora yoronensis]|uniref:hypothetical protein n=1 Tax=Catenulispora yoronensis TaxID=450799 RepID=UPI0031D016E1